MEIYADLRCLQDPSYAFRGIGYHSSMILRAGRNYFSRDARWIGLIDPSLPALPVEYANLVDQVNELGEPIANSGRKLFIQCSPMTHDAGRYKQFVLDPDTLSAALVYDFIPLDMADRYLSNPSITHDYLRNLAWLAHHDLLFPISQYSADRLMALVDVAPPEVHVTGVSLRPEFEKVLSAPLGSSSPDAAEDDEYFLFVGGADRRKNLDVVLRAHARLNVDRKPALVIVGSYPPSLLDEAVMQYRSFGGDPAHLKPQSDLSDRELAALYRDCLCMICSSEIEGFSLPPVEAICCGSPVLLSRNEAHLELIDYEDATFHPHDDLRLRSLLERAIEDREWLEQLARRESGVAKRFRRDRVAYRFWGKVTQRLKYFSRLHAWTHRSGRKSLAILSPFPPDRSGVADYTRKAVEEIGKLVDVDVFCETIDPQPTQGVRSFQPLSDRPYTCGEYDQILSVVGNSHFHTRIIEAQMRHGGPCLIHDNRLAELYNWWKGPQYFQQLACRSLGRHVGFSEAQEWINDPGKLPSMFYDELIPSTRPLLVHSRGIQEHVKAQYGLDAVCLPFCVYRNFLDELLTAEAKAAARSRLSISPEVFAIITLGLVSPVKSPELCIQAVAETRRQGLNAHLYFVGSMEGQETYIRDLADRHGVSACIHQHQDWVDEQTYRDYLIAADLAVQLRIHFMGGLSGALSDCIAAGLTTVANEDLARALDAPGYVLRVPDHPTFQEIASHILLAAERNELKQRISPERERYLESHSFSVYARQLVKVLGLSGSQDHGKDAYAA